jgi:hypothetical protein
MANPKAAEAAENMPLKEGRPKATMKKLKMI